MVTLGTPLSPHAFRVLLLGSGELGKEVAIELQRFGVEVIAADRYADAPAMQVAHRSHVLDMLDGAAVRALIALERPHLIVPEIEAIHTQTLVELEREFEARGSDMRVIPTARAARLTMDREGIRRLAAETLGLPTSPYRFVDTLEDYRAAVAEHRPAVRGQAGDVVLGQGPEPGAQRRRHRRGLGVRADRRPRRRRPRHRRRLHRLRLRDHPADRAPRRRHHVLRRRSATCRATATTARAGSRSRCRRRRWQRAQEIAQAVTDDLGGWGVFGVELFVQGDEVWFSEVSPRPHDTGLVTLLSQDLSEFALHARAILGLPIPAIRQLRPVGVVRDARAGPRRAGVRRRRSGAGAGRHRSCACSASRAWKAIVASR